MGLINKNTFCTTLQPQLFTMDLNVVEHKIAALNALAACNYLPQSRKKIIAALFKALNSTNSKLQEAGKACMKKFLKGATMKVDQIHTHMRPLLMMLGDYRSLTLNVVNLLTSQYNICSFVVLRRPTYLMVPVSMDPTNSHGFLFGRLDPQGPPAFKMETKQKKPQEEEIPIPATLALKISRKHHPWRHQPYES
ncbi:transformation/transcription domain-associated protein-like [Cervus elaphus]|uniref:transformation/transcription domain-associated protein-like n=1 Tax=Cervus elaphus TaxID=9860 RepID=UPI001CC277B5|nr:transformation/transcription domain-associated protein-like [Cervus elaphus]